MAAAGGAWVKGKFVPAAGKAGFPGGASFGDLGGAAGRALHGGDIAFDREQWREMSLMAKRFSVAHEIMHQTVEPYILRNNNEWNLAESALLIREGQSRAGVPYKLFVGGNMRVGEAISDGLTMALTRDWGGNISPGHRAKIARWARQVTGRAGYSQSAIRQDVSRIISDLDSR